MAEALEETPIYGGDTKPAMVKYIGLPMAWVGGFFVALMTVMNLFVDLRAKAIAIVLVLAAGAFLWALLRNDHNALRIIVRYLRSKFLSFDTRHWNGATLEPFPLKSAGPQGFFDD